MSVKYLALAQILIREARTELFVPLCRCKRRNLDEAGVGPGRGLEAEQVQGEKRKRSSQARKLPLTLTIPLWLPLLLLKGQMLSLLCKPMKKESRSSKDLVINLL